MAQYLERIEFNNNELIIHYYIKNGLHQLDAKTFNSSQCNIIFIIDKIFEILDINVNTEVTARNEGGLKDIIMFRPKNNSERAVCWLLGGAGTIFTGVIINIITNMLTSDPELESIQKNNYRVQIETLKEEVKQTEQNEDIIKLLNKINSNIESFGDTKNKTEIRKKQSALYKSMQDDNSIEYFAVEQENDKKNQILAKVSKESFDEFIIEKPETSSYLDKDATIEIISPVLNNRNYKWKGEYNGEVIDFYMSDKEFKKKILNEDIQFGSKNILSAKLEMKISINEEGKEKSSDFKVIEVLGTDTKDGFIEMVRPIKNKTNNNQLDLFSIKEK